MKASKTLARPFAAALGIAAFAVVPANAADVVFQEPPAPQPIAPAPIAVDTWSGPYLGLSLGYGFSGRVAGDDLVESIPTRGWMGGAFGGYNFQHGMMVYGGEADINYSRLRGTNAADEEARTSVDGSLRARAGVAVTDDILLYGTAGVAAERLRVTNAADDSASRTMIGFTAGAGMDARLTDQVFGRVEYRYTHYGNRDFGTDIGTINSRNHRVSVGLGVKF